MNYCLKIDDSVIKALDYALGIALGEGQTPVEGDKDYPAWKDFLDEIDKAIADKKKADH